MRVNVDPFAADLFHADELLYARGTAADIDNAIKIHLEVLDKRRMDDPNRGESYRRLAECLRIRFDSQRDVGDLESSISHSREALNFPLGGVQRSMYLNGLAECLEARYGQLGQFSDLEEATKIRQEHPDPHSSHHHRSDSNPSHIKHALADAIQEVLEPRPHRLLNTHDGIICDRQSQIAMFKSSLQYKELLTSGRDHGTITHSDLTDIHQKIAAYFRYATLSHRWGESEPLLEDVQGRNIYRMSGEVDPVMIAELKGLKKLQNFCRVAKEHDCLWAWSDTCCINKKNDAIELQSAINSMFMWYCRSALTIVYFSDVPPNPDPDELSTSKWFTRGWTLQELLAPQKVLFYSQDWSLYPLHEASDHKQDKGMLTQLERITGIPSKHLMQFSPGVSNARLKLRWASNRRTTHEEDIAYCLFGIFDLQLPVLYGEATEKALGRLLQEIISQSGDSSVLDWTGKRSSFHSCFPATIETYLFAPSAQSELDDIALQQSLSRLRQLVNPLHAQRFHDTLATLPFPQFSNRRLLLPCIVHRIWKVDYRRMDGNNYVYEVQAANLRPLIIMSPDQLRKNTQMGWLPYLVVRALDQSMLRGIRGGDSDSTYKVMVELERPFSALLLVGVSFKTYKRIASSHIIVARIDDSKRLPDSEFRALNIV